jgi:hypothetical protein
LPELPGILSGSRDQAGFIRLSWIISQSRPCNWFGHELPFSVGQQLRISISISGKGEKSDKPKLKLEDKKTPGLKMPGAGLFCGWIYLMA